MQTKSKWNENGEEEYAAFLVWFVFLIFFFLLAIGTV